MQNESPISNLQISQSVIQHINGNNLAGERNNSQISRLQKI